MTVTREDVTVVPAALVLLRAGRRAEAQAIASELGQKLQRRSRAYGAIVEGEIARSSRRFGDAKDAFERAQNLADLWLGRFLLGVLYVDSENYLSAQTELDIADKRRGEATAVFLDDVPSFRYLAPLPYWLGRAQEGVNKASPAAAANYKRFLSLRPDDSRDPLVADARKRLAGLSSPR